MILLRAYWLPVHKEQVKNRLSAHQNYTLYNIFSAVPRIRLCNVWYVDIKLATFCGIEAKYETHYVLCVYRIEIDPHHHHETDELKCVRENIPSKTCLKTNKTITTLQTKHRSDFSSGTNWHNETNLRSKTKIQNHTILRAKIYTKTGLYTRPRSHATFKCIYLNIYI